LESVRRTPSVKICVNVTSDKCYENKEWIFPYRENDSMGGRAPTVPARARSSWLRRVSPVLFRKGGRRRPRFCSGRERHRRRRLGPRSAHSRLCAGAGGREAHRCSECGFRPPLATRPGTLIGIPGVGGRFVEESSIVGLRVELRPGVPRKAFPSRTWSSMWFGSGEKGGGWSSPMRSDAPVPTRPIC